MAIERFERQLGVQVQGARTGAPEAANALSEALGQFRRTAQGVADVAAADLGAQRGAEEGASVDAPRRRSELTPYGQAFNETATRAHFAAIDTDIRETMNRFEMEHPADTASFDASVEGYQKGLLEQVEPRVRPQVQQEIRLQALHHRAKVRQTEQKLILEQGLADILENVDGVRASALGAARDGDVEFMEHERGKLLDAINAATQSPENPDAPFSPQDAQAAIREFERQADTELVIGDFERILRDRGADAGQQAIDAFAENPMAELGPLTTEDRDRILARMNALQSQQLTREGREAAKAKAENDAAMKALRERTTRALKVLEEGFVPEGLEQLTRDVEGTPLEGEVQIAAGLASQAGRFGNLPPSARAASLERIEADMRGREVNPVEVERLRVLERAHENLNRAMEADPLGLAIRQGVVDAPSPLDLSSPETIAESLSGRVSASQKAESHFQLANVSPITAAEADQISEMWAASSAENRVRILGGMTEGLGSRAMDAFQQIHGSGADIMAWTGGMVAEGKGNVARQVLIGLDELEADPKLAPQDIDARPELEEVRRAYPPSTSAAVVRSVTAHYAHQARMEGDFSGNFEPRRMKRAIDAVTGGVIRQKLSMFGPESHFPAPADGVQASDVQRWFDGLGGADVELMGGVAGFEPDAALDAIRREGQLLSIGRGEWLVSLRSTAEDGSPVYLLDESGEPFVLRWDTSAQEVQAGMRIGQEAAEGMLGGEQ